MNYYYMAMRGSLVIGLNTDLDHHLADEIREVIDEVVEERGIRSIIFDFSKVTFMDSSGIGLIMGRYKKNAPDRKNCNCVPLQKCRKNPADIRTL